MPVQRQNSRLREDNHHLQLLPGSIIHSPRTSDTIGHVSMSKLARRNGSAIARRPRVDHGRESCRTSGKGRVDVDTLQFSQERWLQRFIVNLSGRRQALEDGQRKERSCGLQSLRNERL
jgi:hypothetical protein